MSGKRSAHERFPEVISAAVRVFTHDGYRAARMSDVARAAGLSEAALYRYVESKEGLFVLAIRHALLLEDMPSEDGPGAEFPLKPPPLARMLLEVREFVAAECRSAPSPRRWPARSPAIPPPSSRRSCGSCSRWKPRPGRPPT